MKPFDLLEPPGKSSTGLTSGKRREIFLNQSAVEGNTDVAKNQEWFGCDLSLIEFPEWQRTKHVHRIHPYLGKFIPQLAELFLRRFFRPGDTVLDPFSGSGTTLVEANLLGINSLGIELSPFNALIQQAKTRKYDLATLESELKDALARTEAFSDGIGERGQLFPTEELTTESKYLNRWFAPKALQQMLFYRSIISEYDNADVLKIVLSRTARSCRLITHFDLARPKKPLKPGRTYYCRKHKRDCKPIEDGIKFFRRYSRDTVARLKEFAERRTDASAVVVQGDAVTVDLPEDTQLDGIFTSPPYVGIIDYHEQHLYAYELFPEFARQDEKEIGPTSLGTSKKAKAAYSEAIASVFRRFVPYLKPEARVLVVANDRHSLYPDLIAAAGLKLVDTFHRPVPMRTEQDSRPYFESIFWAEPA